MAVPNVPFYLSQANTEFKANGWASNIMGKANVPVPGWCSQLAGKSSASHQFTIGRSGNGFWLGYGDGSSVSWSDQVHGNLSPRSWGPFKVTSLGCRYDTYNTSFMTLAYPVSDEICEIKFSDGQTFVFEFLQSNEGSCTNEAGWAAKIRSLVGQTVGINMRAL